MGARAPRQAPRLADTSCRPVRVQLPCLCADERARPGERAAVTSAATERGPQVRQVASRTVSRLTGSFSSTAKQSSPLAQPPQSSTGWRLHGIGELNATAQTMEQEGEVSVEAVQGA